MIYGKVDVYTDEQLEIVILKFNIDNTDVPMEMALLPHTAINFATTILAHTLQFVQPKKEGN